MNAKALIFGKVLCATSCVFQVGLEFTVDMPQPPEHSHYRSALPCPDTAEGGRDHSH